MSIECHHCGISYDQDHSSCPECGHPRDFHCSVCKYVTFNSSICEKCIPRHLLPETAEPPTGGDEPPITSAVFGQILQTLEPFDTETQRRILKAAAILLGHEQ